MGAGIPDTRDWHPAVIAVLERAGRLMQSEAVALDVALRRRPGLDSLAWDILRGIEREGVYWGTRPDWEVPFQQWFEAKRRVGIAVGASVPAQDDGSVVWGAATAAACAALGSWASLNPALRGPWDQVIDR
jgi:hypothetical protein